MRKRALPVSIAALLLLSGCGQSSSVAIEITSSDVIATSIASKETPKFSRVIALANGSAEIIDSLGFKKILIGRDIASTDESLKQIPIVTSGHQVVAEKIIALSPDLVIVDSSVGPHQAIETLRSAGIKVESISEAWRVEEITVKVSEVSALLGVKASGEELSQKIELRSREAGQKLAKKSRIAFLYLRGGNAIYLLGGKGSGADSLLSTLGAVDVGAAISDKPYTTLTSESFAQASPDILLVMSKGLESVGGLAGLVALPGIAQTPAGKNKAVIAVDDSLLLSFGPRTPDLLKKMAAAISKSQDMNP